MVEYDLIKKLADDGLTDTQIGEVVGLTGKEVAAQLRENGYSLTATFEQRVAMNKAGFSISEIADRLRVNRQVVHAQFKSRKQPIMKYHYRNRLPLPPKETLLSDYANGLSIMAIAKKYKVCGYTRLQQQFAEWSVDTTVHRKGGRKKKA